MDSMIPLIIVAIIGALLSGKKKKKPSQQEEAKPFTAQQGHPEGPVKKLKEMYKELQQEMQQETERQQPAAQSRQTPEPVPHVQIESAPNSVKVSVPPKREGRNSSRSRGNSKPRGRQSTRMAPSRIVQTKQSKIQVESIMPKSKDDLIKGVIFSEIYGPPKSKR